ncbi:MAG TPA: T9SS type A sorting domain-containing protein [Flavobacteriales bacterium]|nr:T9SS type A sorting domain-containing protein [Flavobacteriales bacterium]
MLLLELQSVAQPVVTADGTLPFVGLSYTEVTASSFVDEAQIGANVVWDYSGLEVGTQWTIEWRAILNQQVQDTWPNAELSRSGDLTGGKYFSVSAEGVVFEGQQFTLSQLIYEDPELVVKFPMNYGDSWNDEWSGTQTGNGTRVGKRRAEVSGYGTLLMPWGAVNDVLRVDLLDSLVIRISPSSNPILLLDTVSQYFKNGHPWWLLEARNSTQSGGTLSSPIQTLTVKYRDALSTGRAGEVPFDQIGLLLFPNPADDRLYIRVPRSYTNATVEVLDATGRSVLLERTGGTSIGEAVLQLNVLGLAPGHYTVRSRDLTGSIISRPFVVHR